MCSGGESITRRELLVHGCLLALLLVFVFPGLFLRGEVIAPGDILFQSLPWSRYAPADWEHPQNRLMSDVVTAFYPYYALSIESIRHGEWPLWNPCELAGMPLMANCQSTVFYPPRALHLLFGLRWGTALFILLKLWLCGASAYLCARGLHLGWHAARFFSVAWMLASYNLIWCNWSLPDVSAWLPIVFLGVEWILEGRQRAGFFTLTLGGVLLLLAGHPETAFAMGLGLGVYFVLRLLTERRRGRQLWLPIIGCAGAWSLALCLCAAQLLPFLEYLRHSATFFDRPQENIMTWLPPSAAAAFWAPRFFGTSADGNYWGDINSNLYSMLYAGWPVWIGAAFLVPACLRRDANRARAACLAGAALLMLGMAFRLPLFEPLHRLPMLSSMIAAYHTAFPLFAIPLLGAMGLDACLNSPAHKRDWLWPALLLGFVAAYIGLLESFFGSLMKALKVAPYVHCELLAACGIAMASLFLFKLLRERHWMAPAAITLLLAGDLILANRGMNPTMPAKLVFPKTELTTYLRELPQPCRVGAGEGNIASGLLAAYGIEEWLGYDGLYPERIVRFQKTIGQDFWNAIEPACAVAYYLHDPRYEPLFPRDEPGRFARVAQRDGLEVYRNNRALPRAYLLGAAECIEDSKALLERMKQPGFEPARLALIETSLDNSLPQPAPEWLGEARVTAHTGNHCSIEVNAQAPAILVLADAYYPGWKAWLDGAPVEVFPRGLHLSGY